MCYKSNIYDFRGFVVTFTKIFYMRKIGSKFIHKLGNLGMLKVLSINNFQNWIEDCILKYDLFLFAILNFL